MRKAISYDDQKIIEIQELIAEEMEFFRNNFGKPSLRKFADWLTEKMPKYHDVKMSHATIINWRNHGKPFYTEFFEDMLSVYPVSDRRFRFALKMLAAKSPHVWGFQGVVWRLKPSKVLNTE